MQAFKAYSHGKLPGNVNSELKIIEFLRKLTLKGVGLAQEKVIFSIANCFKDNVTAYKCNSIPKTRCEGCMWCTLSSNLDDDLGNWMKVYAKTSVMQYLKLSKEWQDKLTASNTGSDSTTVMIPVK
jgi:hypothetical protein